MSTHTPRVVTRAAQPYVAIRGLVTMATFGELADRLPGLFGWVRARGMEPAGAPFFKYNLIDPAHRLEVEAGVPVAAAVPADGAVRSGVLPAGRYASLTHVGHPGGLLEITARLLDWAAGQGLVWDVSETGRGQRWGCRLELLKTNPAAEPDPDRWEIELAFRLADEA